MFIVCVFWVKKSSSWTAWKCSRFDSCQYKNSVSYSASQSSMCHCYLPTLKNPSSLNLHSLPSFLQSTYHWFGFSEIKVHVAKFIFRIKKGLICMGPCLCITMAICGYFLKDQLFWLGCSMKYFICNLPFL